MSRCVGVVMMEKHRIESSPPIDARLPSLQHSVLCPDLSSLIVHATRSLLRADTRTRTLDVPLGDQLAWGRGNLFNHLERAGGPL